jgi:hypothetical protein
MQGLITLVLRNESRPLRGAAIEVDRDGLPDDRVARGAGFSSEPLQSIPGDVVDVDIEVHDGEYNCFCSYVQRSDDLRRERKLGRCNRTKPRPHVARSIVERVP